MIQISKETVELLGFDLRQAVDDFAAARVAHASTVGEPAPRAHPLVEQIVFNGGEFEVVEPQLPPQPEETLADYVRRRTREIRTAGTRINGAHVSTDPDSLTLINGMAALAQQNSERVFNFDAGEVVQLTAAQAIAFAAAVGAWVQSTFDKRAEILTAITSGEITTKEQIDAALSAP